MIIVDEMRTCKPTRKWPWRESCHLFGGTLEELHLFAAELGMKRCWFHDRDKLPHYDLTGCKRLQALRLGAREASIKEVVATAKNPLKEVWGKWPGDESFEELKFKAARNMVEVISGGPVTYCMNSSVLGS